MAIQNAIPVAITILCDGSSSSFNIDLLKDPYLLQGNVPNWFADKNKVSVPTGVFSPDPNITFALSGSVVTVTFSTAPSAGTNNVTVYVIF